MVSPLNDSTSLSSLPDEVLVEVLPNLPFDALQKMRITDKRFYGLISDTPVILLNAMETFQDPRIALLGAKTLGKNTRLIEKFLEITGMDKWEMEKWNWEALLAGSRYTLDDIGTPSAEVKFLDLTQLYCRLQFFNRYARSFNFDFNHFYPNASSNRDFVLAGVKRNRDGLKTVDPSLKKDFEIVLVAVSNFGLALKYADTSLKKDPGVVLPAVLNCGPALMDADSSLQDNELIVRIAFLQNMHISVCASDRLQKKLKTDKIKYLDFVRESMQYFQQVNYPLIKNKPFVLKLIKITDGLVFQYLDSSQRNDEEFLKAALREDRNALSFTSDHLKEKYTKDKITVLNVISKDPMYFSYIDSSLKDDEDVLEAALFYIGKQVQFLPKDVPWQRDFILLFASDRLQKEYNNRK